MQAQLNAHIDNFSALLSLIFFIDNIVILASFIRPSVQAFHLIFLLKLNSLFSDKTFSAKEVRKLFSSRDFTLLTDLKQSKDSNVLVRGTVSLTDEVAGKC